MKPSESPRPTTFILEGFLGNHSRWERLRTRIQNEIGPCRIWRYDNSGQTSLEVEGRALRKELRKTDGPINLVGYSMGGIVIREAQRTLDRPIRRAVFLHSPHYGTYLSYLFPHLPACREMRPSCPFLERLNSALWDVPTLATWCAWDAVIVPGIFAKWKKATSHFQSRVPAHAWPVFSPGLHNKVVRFLGSETCHDSPFS